MLTEGVLILLYTQYSIISASDPCGNWKTCQQCITDPNTCVYCAMDGFDQVARCKSRSKIESEDEEWCPKDLQRPNSSVEKSLDEDFGVNKEKRVVQIKPQQYKITLQTGKPEKFNFSFQGAENFPVDLYFLMDASNSMAQIKDLTEKQSKNIYDFFKNATNDVSFGLGTFIDKRLYPMTNSLDPKQTYSFRHHLKLGPNYKLFKEEVSNISLGVNIDPQEGGLDALAQVMTCSSNENNIIGWRKDSRKIIIYMSDGPYHAAGDGRAAGVFQPYDGKCYTDDKSKTYLKELEMDYPSVAMINMLAVQHDVIIVFLVSHVVDNVYKDLSNAISGSKFYTSTQSSSEFVQIFKDIYDNISKKIILKVKSANRRKFDVTFVPDCTTGSIDERCYLVKGKDIPIVGTITLLEYNGLGADQSVVDINVEGIAEKLTLNIDVIKKCDCEDKAEEHSALCNNEKRVCGGCDCGSEKYGITCACIKGKNNALVSNNSTCVENGTFVVCNGRGDCKCGSCFCRVGFTGEFCQCNDNFCALNPETKEKCSGNEHGECLCGKCKCKPEWTGDACDCTTLNTSCITSDAKICNGHGECNCGECQCKSIGAWDARHKDAYCKMTCTDCHNLQCLKLETCALCRRAKHENCDCDSAVNSTIVEVISADYINSTEWRLCPTLKVDTGCYSQFVYQYKENEYGVNLIVQNDKNCAESHILFGSVFLVSLILVGLGTLLAWKIFTTVRDRKEYERFIRQHRFDQTGPNSNPLYTPPSTTFTNPAFRRRSLY